MNNLRGTTAVAVLLLGWWTILPAPVAEAQHGEETPVAAQGEEAHGADAAHEGPTLFTGDLGNIFWTLLTFGLVIWVLGKFAWGPLLTALQRREQFIRDALANAKEDRESAEATLKQYEEKLHAARDEATALVDEGRRDAEVVKRRIEQDARGEADAMVQRAKREIELARDSAVKELYGLTAQLATDVAGRIIRKELSPADHDHLVAESIQALSEAQVGSDGRRN